jgi:hypothetical protein
MKTILIITLILFPFYMDGQVFTATDRNILGKDNNTNRQDYVIDSLCWVIIDTISPEQKGKKHKHSWAFDDVSFYITAERDKICTICGLYVKEEQRVFYHREQSEFERAKRKFIHPANQ